MIDHDTDRRDYARDAAEYAEHVDARDLERRDRLADYAGTPRERAGQRRSTSDERKASSASCSLGLHRGRMQG